MEIGRLTVHYEQNPLWKKYGLSHSAFWDTPLANWANKYEDLNRYYDLVEICHDQVCWYLEKHPEYPWHTPGHMYFDVVNLIPKALEAMNEACAILDRYKMLYHPK